MTKVHTHGGEGARRRSFEVTMLRLCMPLRNDATWYSGKLADSPYMKNYRTIAPICGLILETNSEKLVSRPYPRDVLTLNFALYCLLTFGTLTLTLTHHAERGNATELDSEEIHAPPTAHILDQRAQRVEVAVRCNPIDPLIDLWRSVRVSGPSSHVVRPSSRCDLVDGPGGVAECRRLS